ncbi:MAG: histidine phosphatase family protein [candidate division NC10 bacterium]|nr:histidine phosphatase family protein [candidate division NC10 bacterium]
MRPKRSSVPVRKGEFPAKQVFLVRHAEAVGTREGQFVGRSDPPLSSRGRRHAERIARKMARVPAERVISSPKRRALETARCIASIQKVSVEIRPELAELDFGEWEGRSWRNLAPRERRLYQRWLADPWRTVPPEGESLRSLWSRVGRFWRDLRSSRTEGAAIVVAHAGSLRVLLCHALQLPPRAVTRFVINLGAISSLKLTSNHGWLVTLNHETVGF